MKPRQERDTSFRSKTVVFTERDERAFARALLEFDPGLDGCEGFICEDSKRPNSYCDMMPGGNFEVSIRVIHPEERKGIEDLDRFGLGNFVDAIHLHYRRSHWEWPDPDKRWAFDPPLLGWGRVYVAFPRGDKELSQYALKMLRLTNKVTWKGGMFGLGACVWSQSGNSIRRGLGNGELIPKSETITLNKYYDDSLWSGIFQR